MLFSRRTAVHRLAIIRSIRTRRACRRRRYTINTISAIPSSPSTSASPFMSRFHHEPVPSTKAAGNGAVMGLFARIRAPRTCRLSASSTFVPIPAGSVPGRSLGTQIAIIIPVKKVALLLLAAAASHAQPVAEVRGSVVDARGGEALSNVVVQLVGGAYRATTDSAGRFRIPGVAAGDYVLNVSTVGYHLLKKSFHLDAGETKDFEVILSPETFRQTDSVEVQASPFEPARQDSPSTLVLGGNDAKNLASVLADDPLRSVQGLPGFSSNNDFDARFSVRGADFSRIGLYLDGVLLHAPFHMLQGQQASGSATAFNGDMVEELELHEGAFPVRYEDRSAGVLDVHTRDGNRTGNTFRVAASASNAGVMAEGPLGGRPVAGKKQAMARGSWMVGARKSYLQYIFQRTFPDTSFIFGFEDVQGRVSYDLTPKNNITLYVLESSSALNRNVTSNLGINALVTAGYHYTLGNLGWRYSPSAKLLIVNHAAWMREKFDNYNPTK